MNPYLRSGTVVGALLGTVLALLIIGGSELLPYFRSPSVPPAIPECSAGHLNYTPDTGFICGSL
jgi:hypothetical protein